MVPLSERYLQILSGLGLTGFQSGGDDWEPVPGFTVAFGVHSLLSPLSASGASTTKRIILHEARKSTASSGKCPVIYRIYPQRARNILLWKYRNNSCSGSTFGERSPRETRERVWRLWVSVSWPRGFAPVFSMYTCAPGIYFLGRNEDFGEQERGAEL